MEMQTPVQAVIKDGIVGIDKAFFDIWPCTKDKCNECYDSALVNAGFTNFCSHNLRGGEKMLAGISICIVANSQNILAEISKMEKDEYISPVEAAQLVQAWKSRT